MFLQINDDYYYYLIISEIIPRTLAQNCGANTIRTLTALRAKHATGLTTAGIDGETGEIVDMAVKGIWEPLAVKLQVMFINIHVKSKLY